MQKFAILGLGRFGDRLARSLVASGAEVIAIDRNGRPVEHLRDEVTLAVRLDSTDPEALQAQGVDQVDVAIVGIGEDFESAALTVAALHELGVRRIIARAMTELQGKILLRVGACEIAQPENESAMRWAHRLMLPNLSQYVELGEGHSMIYRSAPKSFHQEKLKDLDLRNKYGVNLVAIERRIMEKKKDSESGVEHVVLEIPFADTSILPTDTLVLIGSNESLAKLPAD